MEERKRESEGDEREEEGEKKEGRKEEKYKTKIFQCSVMFIPVLSSYLIAGKPC